MSKAESTFLRMSPPSVAAAYDATRCASGMAATRLSQSSAVVWGRMAKTSGGTRYTPFWNSMLPASAQAWSCCRANNGLPRLRRAASFTAASSSGNDSRSKVAVVSAGSGSMSISLPFMMSRSSRKRVAVAVPITTSSSRTVATITMR